MSKWRRVPESERAVRIATGTSHWRAFAAAIVLCCGSNADVLAQACDAYFAFDGNTADQSGNGNDGQMIGPRGTSPKARYAEGRHGQALHLDGSSAMRAFVDLHPDTCPRLTISAWIRVESNDAKGGQHLVSTGSGHGPGISIMGRSVILNGTANGLWQRDALRDRQAWFFVAGTYDYVANEYTLYWGNRKIEGTLNERHRPPEDALWVGVHNDSLSGPVQSAYVDELRIIGRVLPESEIRSLATAATGRALAPELPKPVAGFVRPAGNTGVTVDATDLPERPTDVLGQGGALLEAPPGADAGTAGLSRPEGLPADTLQEDLDTSLEGAQAQFDEQNRQRYERNFGPRNRAQVAFGDNFRLAYVSSPNGIAVGPGHLPALTATLNGWRAAGKGIREIFRIGGSGRIVAVADDGSLAVEDSRTPPSQGHAVVGTLGAMANGGQPIDVVADRMGDYLIVSGTQVRAFNAPQGAVDWAEAELADGVQVTAMALLNGDAWIGVSSRAVGSGGMTPTHWGQQLLADIRRFAAAGERIEDIAAGTGSVSDLWAIATDKRIFVRGIEDCRDYLNFGASVENDAGRQWDCHFVPRNCLSNRATWTEQDMASPADPNIWEVNLLVTIGAKVYDRSPEDRDDFGCWLEAQLQRAERLYNDTPRLRIKLRTERRDRIDGVDLDNFVMESDSDYNTFMDEHFDIMAKSRTEGYFPVLVARRICVGYEDDGSRYCIGGRARFPHSVSPLTRKFGIVMLNLDPRDHLLAHEFGHYLGLIHTFQPSSPFSSAASCNEDYRVDGVDNPKCSSCVNGIINSTDESCSGDFNIMDYCSGDNDRTYINQCQQDRAVDQRERYLTGTGQTDYLKMKGRLGEPYCRDDGDCLDDEYCNTGVGTIGRNVCKSLLPDGAACSRSGQCESGTCSLLICRAD